MLFDKVCIIFVLGIIHQTYSIQYPEAFRNLTDGKVYNGVKVLEPYKWMKEKENASKVQTFINEQNKLTKSFVSDCASREKFENFLVKAEEGVTYENARKLAGNRYAYTYKAKTGNVSYWHLVQDLEKDTKPRRLDYDGDNVILSPDASLFTYFDQTEKVLQIKNVTENDEILLETLSLIDSPDNRKFQWLGDASGFFYINKTTKQVEGEDEKSEYSVEFHKVGSPGFGFKVIDFNDSNICRNISLRCEIDKIRLAHDASFLFVASSTYVGDTWMYSFNLIKLSNPGEKQDFKCIPLKHDIPGHFLDLIDINGGKVYLRNIIKRPHAVSQVEITAPEGNTLGVRWGEDVFKLESVEDDLDDAVAVDNDKMILSISPKTGRGNHSVQLRKIEDGTLIRQFDLSTHQKLAVDSFTPRNRDPQIFLSSSVASNLYEMFLLNVSHAKPQLEPIKTQNFETIIEFMTYSSSLNNNLDANSVSILRRKNSSKKSRPAFIFLNGAISSSSISFVEQFDALLVLHEKLNSLNDSVEYSPYFESWIEMERNVQNVVDIAESLIARGYTDPSQLFLVGLSDYAAMGANVMNARPEIFSGVLLSRTENNFNPMKHTTGDLCPDGYFGNWCTDINKAVFPLVHKISPLLHVGDKETSYPTLVMNLYHEIPQNTDFKTDIYGLEYLAEMQSTVGSKALQIKPFLLTVNDNKNDTEYEYSGTFTEWADFLCVLEKSSGLKLSA